MIFFLGKVKPRRARLNLTALTIRTSPLCRISRESFVFHLVTQSMGQMGKCLVQTPSGCPLHQDSIYYQLTEDQWSYTNYNARYRVCCLQDAKVGWNSWCGIIDTITQWNDVGAGDTAIAQQFY